MVTIRSTTVPSGILGGLAGNTAYQANVNMTYYFASSTDTWYGGNNPITYGGATGTQQNYLFTDEATRAYASAGLVTNLSFSRTFTANQADLTLYGATNLDSGGALNGFHYFPGLNLGGGRYGGYGVIDQTNSQMSVDPQMLGDASHRSRTIIHEIGHGLGLAHPHDTGNGTTLILNGTNLDSELYTTLSYNRWYQSSGFNQNGTSYAYGHAAGYMALDIAALQYLYGADMTANVTATNYRLTDAGTTAIDVDGSDGTVSIGRALYSIWDAGGSDQIAYTGASRVIINLNDATLNTNDATQSADLLALGADIAATSALSGVNSAVINRMSQASYYAGGFFSQILNANGTVQAGGYSIASGAIIENAVGGSNNDILIGNEQANTIWGNGGSDYLFGGAGNDYLLGGEGNDFIYGGTGADIMFYDGGADRYDGGAGIDYVSYASHASGASLRIDLITQSNNSGLALGDTYFNTEAFFLSQGNDLFGGDDGNNFVFGQEGSDAIAGGYGGDIIYGEGGNDWIYGGALSDILVGGTGIDTFYYSINQIEQDQIMDFVAGYDKLQFDDVGFNLVGQAIYAGLNFLSLTSGSTTIYNAGQSTFIYYSDLGLLYSDTDGAGGLAPNLIAAFANKAALSPIDFIIS